MRDPRLRALVMVGFLVAAAGWCQSNEVLDALIAEEQATLGGAAYLVLTASGLMDESVSTEDAVADLRARPWGFEEAAVADPVTLGKLAYLAMRAFDLKGGILYSIFPGGRYAARELSFRGWVPGSSAAGRMLTGREVTHIVGKVLEGLGQREEEEVAP